MIWFARTATDQRRHQALGTVVSAVRESLGDSIDGEWGWIDEKQIELVRSTPGLRGLGIKLGQEIEDGGAAHISKDEADTIAAAVGQYIDGCDWPDEPDWDSPEIRYALAKHYIGTGEWIWTDAEYAVAARKAESTGFPVDMTRLFNRVHGPITREQYEAWLDHLAQQRLVLIGGIRARSVQ